jgi:putative membrane protein
MILVADAVTNFWMDIAKLWAFGISGVALMFVGYWIFDKLTPKIDFAKELVENRNIAVAIMVASIIFGVAVIVAATIFFPSPPPMPSP